MMDYFLDFIHLINNTNANAPYINPRSNEIIDMSGLEKSVYLNNKYIASVNAPNGIVTRIEHSQIRFSYRFITIDQ
jgi:hypothetical protein